MAPTDLSSITDSSTTASISGPLFSLQDAIKVKFKKSDKHTYLFPHACKQPGNSHNCTTSCLSNSQMFASRDTLHNCVVWPSIYVEDEESKLVPSAVGLAKSLGLEKGDEKSTLPSKISNSIQNCLLDSCDADPECAFKANGAFPSGGFRKNFTAKVTGNLYYGGPKLPGYFNPCEYISSPVIPDVAGVGVFISYVMQMGLALIAFVLAIPWKRAAHKIRDGTISIWHMMRPGDRTSDKPDRLTGTEANESDADAEAPRRTLTFDPASAVVPAMVEFQKAQCYLMLATNIASLVIQSRGSLTPVSSQQLYNTITFFKVIAIGGYLPITFGLLILRMLNKLGWYVLALSIACVGVAIRDVFIKQTLPSVDELTHLQSLSVTSGPLSCGLNNPTAWCLESIGTDWDAFRNTNTADGAYPILVFCLIILILLTVEHFFNSSDPANAKIRNAIFGRCFPQSRREGPGRGSRVLRWVSRVVVPFLFTISVLIYLYCFVCFGYDLNWFRENETYDRTWGFGQIVAILVWASPVFEYFWESFRGIEEGADHRLPNGYEVRKKKVPRAGISEMMVGGEDDEGKIA